MSSISFAASTSQNGTPGEVQEGVQRALAAVKHAPAGTPLSVLQRQLASVLTPFADRLDSRALSSIMKQQEADWRVVLALYDWMAGQGIPRSIHVYTVVLSCLGRAAQWNHLQSVLDDMARLGVPMDEYVYNTLIVAYSNAGRFNDALGWFERMEKAGCMPNQVIYTTVMKLFARAGRTDGVARIAALLREEGSREGGLFRLDSKTICALIAAYNSMGDLKSAQETTLGSPSIPSPSTFLSIFPPPSSLPHFIPFYLLPTFWPLPIPSFYVTLLPSPSPANPYCPGVGARTSRHAPIPLGGAANGLQQQPLSTAQNPSLVSLSPACPSPLHTRPSLGGAGRHAPTPGEWDVVVWNAMVGKWWGCSGSCSPPHRTRLNPSPAAYMSLLLALPSLHHPQVFESARAGTPPGEWDVVVWNAMVAAYGLQQLLSTAQNPIISLSCCVLSPPACPSSTARAGTPPGEWDVVVWNAMVAAYGRAGKVRQAEELLLQMEAQADGGDRADGRDGGVDAEGDGADSADWGSIEPDWGSVEVDGGSLEADGVGQGVGQPGRADSVGRVQVQGGSGSIIPSTQDVARVQGGVEGSEKHLGSVVNGVDRAAGELRLMARGFYPLTVTFNTLFSLYASLFATCPPSFPLLSSPSTASHGPRILPLNPSHGPRILPLNRDIQHSLLALPLDVPLCLYSREAPLGYRSRHSLIGLRLMARGFYPSTVTFNTLFSLYASLPSSSSSLAAARRLHALMLHMDVPLDVYSCCSLIGLLSRSGQVEEAVGLFERMKAQGVQPDSHPDSHVFISAMIAMFARHGNLELALRTNAQLFPLPSFPANQPHPPLPPTTPPHQPDSHVFSAMIAMFARHGKLKSPPGLARLQCDDRHVRSARQAEVATFPRQPHPPLHPHPPYPPTHQPDSHVFSAMIAMFARHGKLELALRTFQEMKAAGCAVDMPVLTSMIGVYHRLGLLEEASAAAMDAIGCAVDMPVLTSMIGVYHRLGLLEEASAAAMDAITQGSGHLDAVCVFISLSFSPRSDPGQRPFGRCLKAGQLDAAEALFAEILVSGWVGMVGREWLGGYGWEGVVGKAGQLDAAGALFAEILADESGSIADLAAHTTMISVYGKHRGLALGCNFHPILPPLNSSPRLPSPFSRRMSGAADEWGSIADLAAHTTMISVYGKHWVSQCMAYLSLFSHLSLVPSLHHTRPSRRMSGRVRQHSGPGSTHHHDQRVTHLSPFSHPPLVPPHHARTPFQADESGSIADLAAHTTMISVYGKHGLVEKAKVRDG
ncbi:unnamed protein product [Closterium sp. Naga37s-1]|nr:unnamed protein product [Closterium sp. Naga37s-1]